MKIAALFVGCAALAFLAMSYQVGLFDGPSVGGDAAQEGNCPPPREKLFLDLAPVCFGKQVPQAGEYRKSSLPHPMVFFHATGKLHEEWQDLLEQDWQPESVETAELVVVVGEDIKTLLDRHASSNAPNAPTITRHKYELEVRVLAAKNGKELARARFQSMPPPIPQAEIEGAMELGEAVSYFQVFTWIANQARTGFSGNTKNLLSKRNPSQVAKVPPAKAVPEQDQAMQRVGEETVPLPGTTWVGSEDLAGYGPLRFRFVSSSIVTMVDAKNTVPGTWSMTGSRITLRFFEDSVVYEGRVYGQTMSGNANNDDQVWSWRVTRAPNSQP